MDRPTRNLRVLRFSHGGIMSAHRERERKLIELYPIDIELVVPASWPEFGMGAQPVQEDFPIRRLPTILTGNIPLFVYDWSHLLPIFRGTPPDIIDIHEEPYSAACFQILFFARHYFPSTRCVFYTAQNIQKKYPPPFRFMEQYVYKNAAAAYPCSSEAESVLRCKGYTGKSDIIPLGVNQSLFYPATNARESSVYTIGYFGRVESFKGLNELFAALSQLKSELSIRLLIVGSGAAEPELKAYATNAGLANHVSFLGELEQEKVPSIMRKCQVICIPSRTTKSWKEQFGRVAVEAMACGVAIVSSDSGSLPEVIGAAGLLYPEADSNALLQALKLLLLDEGKRLALIEEGKRRVETLYTWERVAGRMFSLYSSVAENDRGCIPSESS